jgi:17beta-estradiol 17-dehydrogenase / very-long-chain 3-oxoacyl-CoA reductase
MDFSKNLDTDYDNLASLIGQSHDLPVSFASTPEPEMNNIITTNCLGTLKVTRLVLPGMSSRRRGLILTMGSFGGLLPTPLLATYSGSKAFLQNWSTALAAEVADLGITVYFVHAYIVTSAMSKVRRATWLFPTEHNFVKSTLARVGNRCGSVGYAYSGTPWWSHALFAYAVLSVAYPFGGFVVGQNLGMHRKIRARALRKKESETVGGVGKKED